MPLHSVGPILWSWGVGALVLQQASFDSLNNYQLKLSRESYNIIIMIHHEDTIMHAEVFILTLNQLLMKKFAGNWQDPKYH